MFYHIISHKANTHATFAKNGCKVNKMTKVVEVRFHVHQLAPPMYTKRYGEEWIMINTNQEKNKKW